MLYKMHVIIHLSSVNHIVKCMLLYNVMTTVSLSIYRSPADLVLDRAEGNIGRETAGVPQRAHEHRVCPEGIAVPAVQNPAQADDGVCHAFYYYVYR